MEAQKKRAKKSDLTKRVFLIISLKMCLIFLVLSFFFVFYGLDSAALSFFSGIKSHWPDALFGIMTNFGFAVIAMFFLPAFLFLRDKQKTRAEALIAALAASIILSFFIKLIFARIRPADFSSFFFYYCFPSLHAVVSFSALPLIMDNYKYPLVKLFFIIVAVLVAVSRLYFSYHFLSDVVFGAVFGWFIGYYILLIFKNGAKSGKKV